MKLFLLIVPFAMFMTACNETTSVGQLPGEWDLSRVTEIQWQLKSFETIAGFGVTLDPNDTIIIVFRRDSTLDGYANGLCFNGYIGSYHPGPEGALAIGPIASTMVACGESRYWPYLSALNEVTGVRYDGRKLFLLRDGSWRFLSFERRK